MHWCSQFQTAMLLEPLFFFPFRMRLLRECWVLSLDNEHFIFMIVFLISKQEEERERRDNYVP